MTDIVFYIVVLLLFVLFAGTPDISDSIRNYIDNSAKTEQCTKEHVKGIRI